jgi:hypothetical protein
MKIEEQIFVGQRKRRGKDEDRRKGKGKDRKGSISGLRLLFEQKGSKGIAMYC